VARFHGAIWPEAACPLPAGEHEERTPAKLATGQRFTPLRKGSERTAAWKAVEVLRLPPDALRIAVPLDFLVMFVVSC
jgi:hypothetical protein